MMSGVDFLRAPGQNFFHGPPGKSGRNPQITAGLLREISGADGVTGYIDQLAAAAEITAKQRQASEALLITEKGRLLVAETAGDAQRQIISALIRQDEIQRDYNAKLNESKSAQETLNLQIAQQAALRINALELEKSLSGATDDIANSLNALLFQSKERLQLEDAYQKLIANGINPELAKEFAQLELTAAKQTELLTLRVAELEAAKAKLTAESEAANALQRQIDAIKEILKLTPKRVDESKRETIEEKSKREDREKRDQQAKEQAARLKQLYGGIVGTLEDGIVGSLQAAIDGLIDGSKRLDDALREIAAGVLKDIGNQLLRFAVNAGMRALFPGAFADGAAFSSSGIKQFASGGIVNKPTMFKFAEGGALRAGLMGEAGPEAIMPLRRGADGRLGVEANGLRQAMGPAPGLSPQSTVLNMNFETSTINGVEYVSREQLEAAMEQTRRDATRSGAQRGMTMTLDRLQQSPSTRRRVGI